jgi:hypothetical protein
LGSRCRTVYTQSPISDPPRHSFFPYGSRPSPPSLVGVTLPKSQTGKLPLFSRLSVLEKAHFDGKHIQPIEEILAESPIRYGFQVAIRGSDNANVDLDRRRNFRLELTPQPK